MEAPITIWANRDEEGVLGFPFLGLPSFLGPHMGKWRSTVGALVRLNGCVVVKHGATPKWLALVDGNKDKPADPWWRNFYPYPYVEKHTKRETISGKLRGVFESL